MAKKCCRSGVAQFIMSVKTNFEQYRALFLGSLLCSVAIRCVWIRLGGDRFMLSLFSIPLGFANGNWGIRAPARNEGGWQRLENGKWVERDTNAPMRLLDPSRSSFLQKRHPMDQTTARSLAHVIKTTAELLLLRVQFPTRYPCRNSIMYHLTHLSSWVWMFDLCGISIFELLATLFSDLRGV